jgi:hypothetical protein
MLGNSSNLKYQLGALRFVMHIDALNITNPTEET